jgi:hypothetical protein
MSSNTELAATATRIAGALADYDYLPAISRLHIDGNGTNHAASFLRFGAGDPYAELRALCAWADEFDILVKVALDWGGSGDATITVDLGGDSVAMRASINSAHAYELGRKIGQPLTKNALSISGPGLLAALDSDETAA